MPAHALSRDELIRVLTAYTGITTADGAAGGTTLVDRNLIGVNDYITGKTILIMSGPARNEDQGALSFDPVTGTITFAAFSAQITAGTVFRVVNISSVENLIIEIAKGQGLIYSGTVTAIPGANQFTIPSLAGMGAGKFDGATNPYSAFVFRDAGGAGAAPQGEIQQITGYVTATGTFTTAPFTAAVAVDDEILIVNPALANAIALAVMLNVPAPDAVANITAVDVIGNKASTAIYAKTNTADIIRYLKGLLDAGIAVPGLVDDVGPAVTDFNTDLVEATNDHYNGMLLMFLDGPNAGQTHTIDDYIGATKNVSFHSGDWWTDVPVNGNRFVILPISVLRIMTGIITWDIFHEQPDTAVNILATAAGETDVLNLAAANTRYLVRSLRLKLADPGAETCTVRLKELVNDILTTVDSFAIDAANFATYHSLMDMFGLPHLAGDRLQLTVQMSGGADVAVTGQYSHATAT